MNFIDVKIKLENNGKMPEYKTKGSAGADCFSTSTQEVMPKEVKVIPLGFRVEIPEGYEMQIRPRSGMAKDSHIGIFGTIDSDYRGVVSAIIFNNSDSVFIVHEGDRIAQAVVAPVTIAKFREVESLSETERGTGGFGSTGK